MPGRIRQFSEYLDCGLCCECIFLELRQTRLHLYLHGMKVLMAENYIDNLFEEARKGRQEKAEQGIWPTKTPLGYRNITGPDGKKIIPTKPAIAPLIAKLFEWYARGDISLKEAARNAHEAGLAYPRSGGKVPVSTFTPSCATASIPAGSNGTAS
jgi:hypothetical protein